MTKINESSVAEIQFILNWTSNDGEHEERIFTTVNIWRDIFPPGFKQKLIGKKAGDFVEQYYPKTANLIAYAYDKKLNLKKHQFHDSVTIPLTGRFYPCGLLKGVNNIFPQNINPFRIITMSEDTFYADLNVPLAGNDFTLRAIIHDVKSKKSERGGTIKMILEEFFNGPGMQVRVGNVSTNFYSNAPFARDDMGDDAIFYTGPRLVSHIDSTAMETISDLYNVFAKPGMEVLDLMSSWQSHLPPDVNFKTVTGLGMNAKEMRENPRLTNFIVHDLNKDGEFPFEKNMFDVVICTVSVEYLIRPNKVFKDVARVLRPGGMFVVTFSNRWFQPKAIDLWPQLHEFERLGLIMDYYIRSDEFKKLNTLSSRGFPRPKTDKYYESMLYSDPVYAVWGEKK